MHSISCDISAFLNEGNVSLRMYVKTPSHNLFYTKEYFLFTFPYFAKSEASEYNWHIPTESVCVNLHKHFLIRFYSVYFIFQLDILYL